MISVILVNYNGEKLIGRYSRPDRDQIRADGDKITLQGLRSG